MEFLKNTGTPIQILLVEDNPGDVRLAMESFKDGKLRVDVHLAKDGFEAMQFLTRADGYSASPAIDLILLDLNLPRKNGLEVLAELKVDVGLRQTPVIVLTSSNAQGDRDRSAGLGVNSYMNKPLEVDRLLSVVTGIEEYWISLVRIPPGIPA